MALSQEYIDQWQAWHRARIEEVNRAYGWLAVVSQDWLAEGEFFASEFVPGQWLLKDDEVYYFPDQEAVTQGDVMLVDGKAATGPTHIPRGINKNSGTGSAVSVFYGDREVETITRLNYRGETIHAVRVRDPQAAARKKVEDIETFPLSEEWIVPATFTPTEIESHDVPTVESSIWETHFTIGTMELTIHGEPYSLSVFGHRGGSEEAGYIIDLTYIHIGDLTSGKETYGGGRVVLLDHEELENTTHLDFNRLISFPCALSTFITCPSTPPGHRFAFRVEAGEYTPPVKFDRTPTYQG